MKYINEHPDSIVCEGDSVEGKKGGKVLLTLFFVQQNLQFAFLRDYNYARSVTNIFEKLYIELRPDILGKILMYCSLITEVSSQILKHLNTISILILERSLETRALMMFLRFNMAKKY